MNRIADFYESNHLLVLIVLIVFLLLYILSIKNSNRNIVTMNRENEYKEYEEEELDQKIKTYSIVKLKYILTGEVITCDFAKNKSNKYKKPFINIKRIYFDNPLAVALFDKEMGDIIKYKNNEFDENYFYVEILNVNNSLSTDEERAMYENNDIKLNKDYELEEVGIPIINGTICNSKDDLIKLLKNWLETNENTIGDLDNFPRNTRWVELNLNGNNYFINADTRREGVLDFINNHENKYPWRVILNNRNSYNKVSNDENGNAIPYLYFYSEVIGQREI